MTTRRAFIKKSALVGAAALAPTSMTGINSKKKGPTSPASMNCYTVNMRSAMDIPLIKPRKITIPDTAGFKVLKGDFHIHTLFSDGQVMPTDRVNEAVQNGLDVIALTEHIEVRPFFSNVGRWKMSDEQGGNFNLSYETAKPEADKNNLLLVPATEITKFQMPPGHFNALFTQDVKRIAAAVDDWKKMFQIAADQGCFLIWDHPGWEAPKNGGIEKGAPLRFTKAHEEAYQRGWLHGIEIFNSTEHYPIVSDWCNERDLAIFANSDIHASELNQYGIQNTARPITLVLAKERTVESVREALFAKRTIAWAANMIWGREPWLPELFNASVEINMITPGTIELNNISSLPITVSAGGAAFQLPHNKNQQIYCAEGIKKLTILNWMIGTNQPLEIPIG